MFISYAQNFEDVILWRALKHIENGFYIDIGAQDPVIDSVSRGFYEKGWRGVHIEPTATYAEKLREDRPDEQVRQVAIGKGGENLRFFEIPETGLSTGDPEIAEEHRKNGFNIIETEVALQPLSRVFEQIGDREVHWLKIDVEGMEKSVIESWLPSKVRPWIIVVESTPPLRQESVFENWESLLFKKDYEFVYFDGLNRFYVSSQHHYLKKKFGFGPNVFDNFAISDRGLHAFTRNFRKKITGMQAEHSAEKAILLADLGRISRELQMAQGSADDADRRADDANRRADDADRRANAARQQADADSLQLELVYNSTSWRVTRPLRALKSTVEALHQLLRAAARGLVHRAMLWLRGRPKLTSLVLRAIARLPFLERHLVAFAHKRGMALSYMAEGGRSDIVWNIDPDPETISKWERLLNEKPGKE